MEGQADSSMSFPVYPNQLSPVRGMESIVSVSVLACFPENLLPCCGLFRSALLGVALYPPIAPSSYPLPLPHTMGPEILQQGNWSEKGTVPISRKALEQKQACLIRGSVYPVQKAGAVCSVPEGLAQKCVG